MNQPITMHTQLAWEQHMIYRGVERYRQQQEDAIAGGRAAETSAGSRLLRSYILQISDFIAEYLAGKLPGRRRHKYARLLEGVNTDVIALFALKQLMTSVYADRVGSATDTLQTHCGIIGTRIEDELKFSKFQTEHKEYYDTIARKFKQRKTQNYRFKRNSMSASASQLGVDWRPWTQIERISVGALIVGLVLEACDLFQIITINNPRKPNHNRKIIQPTPDCIEWVNDHNDFKEVSNPDRMPCLLPPQDWHDPYDGGYLSPRLREMTPLVKRTGPTHSKRKRALIGKAIMPKVLTAVNAVQGTPWRVNTLVLEVMKQVWNSNLGIGMPPSQPYEMPRCPLPQDVQGYELDDAHPLKAQFMDWKATMSELYTMEQERVAKNMSIVRTLRMANDMKDFDKFYYVYQLDFRGRMYCCTSGLSPQGMDQGKALLTFARSETLGDRGWFWLRVHGANKYGYDKVSYEDRVKWVEENHDKWMAVAADAIEHREYWQDADKPWQFLAWVFEYASAYEFGPEYRSYLPVALDGSCNGLQHFSAMLRDTVGGMAVNLVPSDKPSDIYQNVADVATQHLKARSVGVDAEAGAHNWLRLFNQYTEGVMSRKLAKKPVMTLPYGSTQQACTKSIFQWTRETAPDFFPDNQSFSNAIYLSPILWQSIGEVVVAAREAMNWIQACATKLSKKGVPIFYVGPLGFPMWQANFKITTKCIDTQIGGRLQLRVGSETTDLDVRKQRQGSAPNLVHHVDAAHMMMTINEAVSRHWIDCFAMIHDDFGVHASRVDDFQVIIRDTFVDLHTKHNILQDFKDQHERLFGVELPDPPAIGTLDIQKVKESRYFFG